MISFDGVWGPSSLHVPPRRRNQERAGTYHSNKSRHSLMISLGYVFFYYISQGKKKEGPEEPCLLLRNFREPNDLEDQVPFTTVPTIRHCRYPTFFGFFSNLIIGLEKQRDWEVVPRVRLTVPYQ